MVLISIWVDVFVPTPYQIEIPSHNMEENVQETILAVENIRPNITELKIELKEVRDDSQNEKDIAAQLSFDTGKKSWNKKEYSESKIIFEDFLEENKESVLYDEALFYLADSYSKLGSYNKGIEVYKQLINNYPTSSRYTWACYELGNLYYNNSDYKNEAMVYYLKFLENATIEDKKEAKDSIEKIKETYGESLKITYNCSIEGCNNNVEELEGYCEKHTCTKENCDNKREENSKLCAAHIKKKSEGVRLGMTEQDVLDSSWGKPDEINRTTYTFGVHEQWVYRGAYYNNSYLYFEDGILTTIQN